MSPDIMKFIVDEVPVEVDNNGFLLHRKEWSEEIAEALAAQDGIELTEDHWKIINFLRDYYDEYRSTPNVRLLIKVLHKSLDPRLADKDYLYTLFPKGPSVQGCRIAGLPLPQDCIDFPQH
jgi:tRNA 2-thiouridine synthesizing protein E